MLVVIALAMVAAQPRTTPGTSAPVSESHRQQAWDLGYSSYVKHECPNWGLRVEAFHDVLPTVQTWNGPWAQDGALAVAHRNGLSAGEAAQRKDPLFCLHPTRSQPARARELQKVLILHGDKRPD